MVDGCANKELTIASKRRSKVFTESPFPWAAVSLFASSFFAFSNMLLVVFMGTLVLVFN